MRSADAKQERALFRLHLVHRRTELKKRVHDTLITLGHPCPGADLFGTGRRALAGLDLLEPWADDVAAAVRLIDAGSGSASPRAHLPGLFVCGRVPTAQGGPPRGSSRPAALARRRALDRVSTARIPSPLELPNTGSLSGRTLA